MKRILSPLSLGLLLAAAQVVCIILAAQVFRHLDTLFQTFVIGFSIFLLLFVISAAVSVALVVGMPILLYLEKKKKEAIVLFCSTVGWLIIIFVIFFVALI